MEIKSKILLASLSAAAMTAVAADKPNIVVILADDISAREWPIYGSDTWTGSKGLDSHDTDFRAKSPVMEQLAQKGCYMSTCWSATVSMPTRAQVMTGRFAHIQKWWHNGDQGRYKNAEGKQETWPLYESSPLTIGKVAQKAGYATAWSGKTQMAHTDTNINNYGFDEGLYTPGDLSNHSSYTDFVMKREKGMPAKTYRVQDSGRDVSTYLQVSYYWYPSVMAVNTAENTKKNTMQPWPFSAEDKAKYGVTTYGPDVEQDFLFDFMERKQKEKKPFFVYHTTHLGHDAYNFLNPDSAEKWPETPKVEWDGKKYTRTEPKITGDKGVYDTHGTLSKPGMGAHVTYLDYVIWRYLQQFKKMGIEKNTVFIITADNGTSGYGKGSHVSQKGTHVPFLVYAPCLNMTKKGKVDALMNLADILPTIAEIAGTEIPKNYEISGESLIPFLTTKQTQHRDFCYGYKSNYQIIRGNEVLRDGTGKWYDVREYPSDLISFPVITDWSKATESMRKEKAALLEQMKEFDLYDTAHDGPGGIYKPASKGSVQKKPATGATGANKGNGAKAKATN
ncbi:MAG: sulfatase-like hydrolase/transferase [Rikenellaceae bacterium]